MKMQIISTLINDIHSVSRMRLHWRSETIIRPGLSVKIRPSKEDVILEVFHDVIMKHDYSALNNVQFTVNCTCVGTINALYI